MMFVNFSNTINANAASAVLIIAGLFIYHRISYALFPFEENLQKKHIKVNKKLLFLSLNLIALISITAVSFYGQ
jgi:cytochrome bd-type quinol oxidase subunit 2